MGKFTAIANIIPRLIDEETAAHYLGRSRTRFRVQVAKGALPAPSGRNEKLNVAPLTGAPILPLSMR